MMGIDEQIRVAISRDASREVVGDFPITAFPLKLQGILLDLANFADFRIEYSAGAMLSAAATAIGNSYHVQCKPTWKSAPSLYMILVGRPGMGKSHPLKALYKPIVDVDSRLYQQYKDAKDNQADGSKVRLIQTVVGDFTPEALKQVHDVNLHGVAIMVDEIMGLFESKNRYNQSTLITDLLSAYSGSSISVSRATKAEPIFVPHPCINIIGTTQPGCMKEIWAEEYKKNGLTDRFIYVLPQSSEIPKMKPVDPKLANRGVQALEQWGEVVNKLLPQDYTVFNPAELQFNQEAETLWMDWWNSIVDRLNSQSDEETESREMKRNDRVARIALILQLLRWACGESHRDFIDIDSVKGAIALSDFFQKSLSRLERMVSENEMDDSQRDLIDMLPEQFMIDEIRVQADDFGIRGRDLFRFIKSMIQAKRIRRVARGKYEKLQDGTSRALCANGTNALSHE